MRIDITTSQFSFTVIISQYKLHLPLCVSNPQTINFNGLFTTTRLRSSRYWIWYPGISKNTRMNTFRLCKKKHGSQFHYVVPQRSTRKYIIVWILCWNIVSNRKTFEAHFAEYYLYVLCDVLDHDMDNFLEWEAIWVPLENLCIYFPHTLHTCKLQSFDLCLVFTFNLLVNSSLPI